MTMQKIDKGVIMETNLKHREVYCPECNQYYVTDQPQVRCIHCDVICITVLSSQIDGQKLTGQSSLQLPFFQNLKK